MSSTSDSIITLTSLMVPGKTAVVTGASSGIGRAASLRFAQKGMHVWMIDIDSEELLLAQKMVKAAAPSPESQVILAEVADVADPRALELLAEQVFGAGNGCHVLMNNAGIGLGGGALTSMDQVEHVMKVNTYGPIHGVVAFLPQMKQAAEPGIIINTGSKQGITMPPGNLTYNMSKAALKCYTEGLEHELMKERVAGEGHLRAALLVPGWVNTSILLKSQRAKATAKGETFDPADSFFHEEKPQAGAWMPNQVVDFLVEELDRGVFYIICPDNDVDRETDNLRMTWTMADIVQNRPPLSRWHPEYKDKFTEYVAAAKSNSS